MTPINMNFDAGATLSKPNGIVHLSKIYQGAPYDQSFRVQSVDGLYVRDFSTYQEIRLQARLAQTSPVLFELSQSGGTLVGTATAFQIVFPADVTSDLILPPPAQQGINEVRFVYDIQLLNAGVVTERLAQGVGYIVVSTTKNT